MDLRDIKKEVADLGVLQQVKNFQQSWIKPLNKDTNSHLPFLKDLPLQVRAQLNKKLVMAHQHLSDIKAANVEEKLHRLSHSLVEIKLNTLQGDHKKAKSIAKQLVCDEALNIKQTIADAQEFEEKVQTLSDHYEDINTLVHKNLSLEEAVGYMELPHYLYLQQLLSTAKKQKMIVRDLGRHFVGVTKEMSLKRVPHK